MAILIGLILGLVLGLTGAGGAIFAVPLLILLLNLPPVEAMGLALSAVAVSAFFGAFLQRKSIFWLPVFIIILTGVVAAPIGKWLSFMVNETSLVISFSLLTGYIAISMLNKNRRVKIKPLTSEQLMVEKPIRCQRIGEKKLALEGQCLFCLLFGGFIVGLASGLFGVGGGFMIVPLLLSLTGIKMSEAIASSLMIIGMISFTGFMSYLHILITNHQPINFLLISELIIASLVAMVLSQRIRNSISESKLRVVFSISLILMTAFILNKQFHLF